MDPDLDNVIRQALGDAQAAGKDYLTQTEEAVRAARQVRLDMAVCLGNVPSQLNRREPR